jgi:hypothetical protein
MSLTGEQASESGNKERRRRGDFCALLGPNRFHIEKNYQDTD